MLVSKNPAFLAYLGPPISHIRQKSGKSLIFLLFFCSPYFPYYPLLGGMPTLFLKTPCIPYLPWLPHMGVGRAAAPHPPPHMWITSLDKKMYTPYRGFPI